MRLRGGRLKPRLIGDKDRLIPQAEVERVLAFLDVAAETGQPTPAYVARKRRARGRDTTGRKDAWPWFWQQSRFAVRLLLQSGLRCSELAALQVRDCDLGSRPYRILVRGGKKRAADHLDPVMIPTGLADAIAEWVADCAPTDYVIRNRAGRRCSRRWIYELAKAPMEPLGLNPKFATHHYRHRFATSMMQQTDGDLLFVQKQLRHRSLQPTSVYLHLADYEGESMEAVERMGLDAGRDAASPPAPAARPRRALAVQMRLEESRRGRAR